MFSILAIDNSYKSPNQIWLKLGLFGDAQVLLGCKLVYVENAVNFFLRENLRSWCLCLFYLLR